jgi:ATP-binding cassette subfamily F protein 3
MDEYRVFLAERARISGRPAGRGDATGMQGNHKKKQVDQKAVLAPLRKVAKAAEAKLTKLSEERAKVEALLANPALYTPHRMADMITAKTRMSDVVREIKAAEAEWLAAEEALEAAAG